MPFVVVRVANREMREIAAYQFRPAPIHNATKDGAFVLFHVEDMIRAESQAARYASGMIGARACGDDDVLQTITDMQG